MAKTDVFLFIEERAEHNFKIWYQVKAMSLWPPFSTFPPWTPGVWPLKLQKSAAISGKKEKLLKWAVTTYSTRTVIGQGFQWYPVGTTGSLKLVRIIFHFHNDF